MLPQAAGVYCITLNNGKRYVGQAVNISRRVSAHKSQCRHQTKCRALWAAIQKHGVASCEVLLLSDDRAERNRVERQTIAELQLQDRRFGYNLRSGGDVEACSDEVRARMRAAWVVRKARGDTMPRFDRTGLPHSEKTKERIRQASLGRTQRPEWIAKQRATKYQRWLERDGGAKWRGHMPL